MEIYNNNVYINPIIAALRNVDDFKEVISTPVNLVFLLKGEILNIKEDVKKLKDGGKRVFVHLDLIKGLGRDEAAVEFISQEIKADGLITTRGNLISIAKKQGLIATQRMFLLDSLSLATGIELVKNSKPDYLEVLPGIVPQVISHLKRSISCPIIAGGLISTKEEINLILKAGAVAVSVGSKELWRHKLQIFDQL